MTISTQTGIKQSCIVLVIQWPFCCAFTAPSEMTWFVKSETLHPFVAIYPHPKCAWVCIADALCFCSSRSKFVFSVLRVKVLKLWWKQIAGISKIFWFNPDPASMWSNEGKLPASQMMQNKPAAGELAETRCLVVVAPWLQLCAQRSFNWGVFFPFRKKVTNQGQITHRFSSFVLRCLSTCCFAFFFVKV